MNFKRIGLAVIGCLMLLAAVTMYLTGGYTDSNAYLISVCSRLGIVLLTIWLAFPILEKYADRLPAIVTGTLLVILLFLAIRPRLMPWIVAGAAILLVVHFGLRFAARQLK